ncbi:MAG TPA: protein-export chaperone SecB [Alcanivoracaceae bacterium]|nr:protein-export chaperone SecB [Alcanivoracaceae bacterium]
MSDNTPEQVFQLQRIYTKDISFESPAAPQVFLESWQPEVNLQLNTNAVRMSDEVNDFEVTLELTVTAKHEETVIYLVEVQQAGIFTAAGFPDEEMDHLLGSYCPNLLFPYAREMVSSLVGSGTFPQLLLQPINFDALYHQAKQEQAQ